MRGRRPRKIGNNNPGRMWDGSKKLERRNRRRMERRRRRGGVSEF